MPPTFIAYDVLQRRLIDMGHTVKCVRNVTDVDDPLFAKARQLGVHYLDLAAGEEARFERDMEALNALAGVVEPRGPRRRFPTSAGSSAWCSTGASRTRPVAACTSTCRSSRRSARSATTRREEMVDLARERGGNVDDPHKRHPLDFVLWHPSAADEPSWDTMWGPGRPGWHIECSALALRELGTTIDLHGGGTDLIFPHHECERAQSEAATGEPFVRHWMHVAMVYMDGHKMSKSLGNLVFVDALRKEWDPRAIRLAIIEHHYRRDWEWDDGLMPRNAERLAQLVRRRCRRRRCWRMCARRSTTTSTRLARWRPSTPPPRLATVSATPQRCSASSSERLVDTQRSSTIRPAENTPANGCSIMGAVNTDGAGKAQQRVRRVVRPDRQEVCGSSSSRVSIVCPPRARRSCAPTTSASSTARS